MESPTPPPPTSPPNSPPNSSPSAYWAIITYFSASVHFLNLPSLWVEGIRFACISWDGELGGKADFNYIELKRPILFTCSMLCLFVKRTCKYEKEKYNTYNLVPTCGLGNTGASRWSYRRHCNIPSRWSLTPSTIYPRYIWRDPPHLTSSPN